MEHQFAKVKEFEALVKKERGRSLQYVTRWTGIREEAEDAFQEATIRAWKGFHTYDRARSFERWFRVILHHVVADRYRIKRNMEVPLDRGAIAGIMEDRTEQDAPVRVALQMDLHAALMSLPADQRRIIEKKFFEQKTREQIAREEGIGCRTLDKRSKAALARLRALMETEDADGSLHLLAG